MNLAANFTGMAWAALLQLAVVPFYLRWMGAEAFGLVGFFVLLQSAFLILDFGFGPAVNRELARYSAVESRSAEARDFLRTFELLYWLVGSLVATVVVFAAPTISARWLQVESLPQSEVVAAVRAMGVLTGLQFPLTLYQGGLLGLQRQVVLNLARIGAATLTAGASLAALRFVSPLPTVLFSTQVACQVLAMILLRHLLWRALGAPERRAAFSAPLLRRVAGFAFGMAGISITGIGLIQMDKIVLSRFLSLEQFGYYTLAGSVATALYLFISPVFNTLFPRLSALVAAGRRNEVAELYHAGNELMAILVLPVATALALWPRQILFAWTGDAAATQAAAGVVPVLVIGTALNGLMNIPFALQLANGWTRLGLWLNVALLLLAIPALLYLTAALGALGGAAVWAGVNALYLVVGIPLTHRRLLPHSTGQWLVVDVGRPLAATLFMAALLAWTLPEPATRWGSGIQVLGALAALSISAALAGRSVRRWIRELRLSGLLLGRSPEE